MHKNYKKYWKFFEVHNFLDFVPISWNDGVLKESHWWVTVVEKVEEVQNTFPMNWRTHGYYVRLQVDMKATSCKLQLRKWLKTWTLTRISDSTINVLFAPKYYHTHANIHCPRPAFHKGWPGVTDLGKGMVISPYHTVHGCSSHGGPSALSKFFAISIYDSIIICELVLQFWTYIKGVIMQIVLQTQQSLFLTVLMMVDQTAFELGQSFNLLLCASLSHSQLY